ncbi:MAG: hypothetical protein ACKOW2_04010 [Sphingobacteriaceae bacterium]
MRKLLLITALLVTALFSCKKDAVTPTDTAANMLVGKWNQTSKGESFPTGSQQVMTQVSGTYYEFLKDGSWNIQSGSLSNFHWEMVDPNTVKKVETDEIYKVIKLDATDLTLSYSTFKNGVQGEVFLYFKRDVV